MTIIGIGVDVVHIPRILGFINRRGASGLANRILSVEEQVDWQTIESDDVSRMAQFLGVRWAVKEAAYKAMYPSYRLTWRQLILRKSQCQPKPSLIFSRLNDDLKLHCSISHDGDYIFASVLAES